MYVGGRDKYFRPVMVCRGGTIVSLPVTKYTSYITIKIGAT